jgi:serine protein kinase
MCASASLLLVGPVGGGKSTLVTMLKRGLERYSRTDDGAVYAIKDCPMHEEPLHLVPEELRADFKRQFGVHIEGDLCPVCQWKLRHEWGEQHPRCARRAHQVLRA